MVNDTLKTREQRQMELGSILAEADGQELVALFTPHKATLDKMSGKSIDLNIEGIGKVTVGKVADAGNRPIKESKKGNKFVVLYDTFAPQEFKTVEGLTVQCKVSIIAKVSGAKKSTSQATI